MGKHETIKDILISQLPCVRVERLTAITYEIREALFPVGGHMCPCGRDWETKKQIARQLILKIISSWYKERGQGNLDMRSFADYSMHWLDQEKNK